MKYEIDYDKLDEIGIDIKNRDYKQADPQRMFCPKCHKDRKNHRTEKELAVQGKLELDISPS